MHRDAPTPPAATDPPSAVSAGRPVPAALARLGEVLHGGDVLVLTGAGVSTASGIPDYRGADGVMRHAAPMTFQRFTGSASERRRYWARSHLGWPKVEAAQPNATHALVADLERAGRLVGVVTQNVDGLHRKAGTHGLVELHGNLDAVVCLDCGDRRPRAEMAMRLDALNPGHRDRELTAWAPGTVDEPPERREIAGPDTHAEPRPGRTPVRRPDGDVAVPDELSDGYRVPDCRRCGGVLKPDVVFFGEPVPRERFARAMGDLDRARALLVLGSSLAVGSGYRFATRAAKTGKPVVIVTRGWSRADHLATLRLDTNLATVHETLRAAA